MILNFLIDEVGQVDFLPRWIYLDTNDTYDGISGTGYLNGLVKQGIALNEGYMALVYTTDYSTQIFNVMYSNGNWNLEGY